MFQHDTRMLDVRSELGNHKQGLDVASLSSTASRA